MTTIGWPEEPSSSSRSSSDKTVLSPFTPTEGGVLQSATAWLELEPGEAGQTNAKFTVYSDNGGEANLLLAQSDVTVLSASLGKHNYEFTFSGTQTIEPNVPIWIGVSWEDPGESPGINFFRASGSSSGVARQANVYLPSPFGSVSTLSGPQAVSLTFSAGPASETHRFYLTNTDPSFIPWDSYGYWPNGVFGLDNPRRLGESPAGSPSSTTGTESVSDNPSYVMLGQWISGRASGPGVVSGEQYGIGVAFSESDSDANFYPYVNVRVHEGDSNVIRGEAVNLFTADFEFPVDDPAGISFDTTGGVAVDIQQGDRIIVEIGIRGLNGTSSERTGTIHFGGTGTTDMSAGSTDLNRPAWIDLQVTEGLTFDEPPAPGVPGILFDLDNWHLTIPSDRGDGVADQIDQPELETYRSPFFYLDENDLMVFVAPVQGVSTSGESGATRTEFREHEADYDESAWDPATASRQFTITTRADATNLLALPETVVRKDMILWQIHGESGTPPLYVAAEWTDSSGQPFGGGPRVRVYGGDRADLVDDPFRDNPITGLTPDTIITIRCRIQNGNVSLWVIEGEVGDLPTDPTYPPWPASYFLDAPNWYFKAGAYNKQPIADNASGFSTSKISHFELIVDDVVVIDTTRFFLAA